MSKPIEELWPPFGLKITCGTVTLSPVRDTDIPELDALAHAGIHAPSEMPFYFPWTVGSTGEVRLRLMQYHWAQRAAMSPASWTLETTVRFDGEVVGCQSTSTKDYLVTRTAFMFDHLDAAEVTSAAFVDNPASLAVSRKVGYKENGIGRLQRRDGEMALSQRLVLTAEALKRPELELEVEGLRPLRELLGLTP